MIISAEEMSREEGTVRTLPSPQVLSTSVCRIRLARELPNPEVSMYMVVDVVNYSFEHTTPLRAGSGVRGPPHSGAFIEDP